MVGILTIKKGYSCGSMKNGIDMCIIDAVGSGYFFGGTAPMNLGATCGELYVVWE